MGFFDGLKRDSKQNQTIAGGRAPQSQEQREAQADATYREPDPDELEVSMREVAPAIRNLFSRLRATRIRLPSNM